MSHTPEVHKNQSLKSFNTFGVEAIAQNLLQINRLEDLSWFLKNKTPDPLLILSGGSNILFVKPEQPWVLLMCMKGIELISAGKDQVNVKAMAGENWHQFVQHCIASEWHGLENLSLIPGNVGTAPIQNIGAYGVEVAEFIEEVAYVELVSGHTKTIKAKECRFGYRDSIFKHELKEGVVIISVTFRLQTEFKARIEYKALSDYLLQVGNQLPSASELASAVIDIRRSKLPDPEIIGNAGSFFKNPLIDAGLAEQLSHSNPDMPVYKGDELEVKVPAAWLIEHAGWKGYRRGDAGVHHKQALVLVNYGSATGQEILALAHEIRSDVYAKFGIELEMEVNIR